MQKDVANDLEVSPASPEGLTNPAEAGTESHSTGPNQMCQVCQPHTPLPFCSPFCGVVDLWFVVAFELHSDALHGSI